LTLLIVLLSLVLVLAVLFVVPRGGSTRPRRARGDDIDEDELLEAEEELKDLDVLATPEDAAEEIPDWGPGVPKVRKDRGTE
jgi:hypothetical protein